MIMNNSKHDLFQESYEICHLKSIHGNLQEPVDFDLPHNEYSHYRPNDIIELGISVRVLLHTFPTFPVSISPRLRHTCLYDLSQQSRFQNVP